MRWFAATLCAGILLGTDGCNSVTTRGPAGFGVLAFQKDSTCADTTNTELFVDGTSQGQFVMRPLSLVGFNKSASIHIANATEVAGKLRQFPQQAITVPLNGTGSYLMTCTLKPPPQPTRQP